MSAVSNRNLEVIFDDNVDFEEHIFFKDLSNVLLLLVIKTSEGSCEHF